MSGLDAAPGGRDAPWDRLHKFAVEWKMLQNRGCRDGVVYELHPGDPRHAICGIDDIIALLEAANG